ncbi:MFS transporter [Burkholderia cenocepacia]|uniref:MFS transporter n=1 Tax=Burkholderia cepacia complex TaxID=87882 RepID=UPI00158B60A6|nr:MULTISPECIES: MFS transporter [Burkholderia cepacia complex]ELW9445038.1 MFS transporter [Burkholderia cenocepacia]MBR8413357.1 MFS transporter [Burkholderia cenocepacia]MBR8481120.1 MFS transporter [Burkholderia cenocepacia]MCA8087947.1 MFS transporter [Burkholderia cenocepacia]MDN7469583.1 MFS transporter [Burkholderia orbicola]
MSAPARVADAWRRERFTGGFMLLALASGTTISMAQLATTLYALALGVDDARLGIIAAMEPLGIALMTLPAGLLVARYGARRVYFAASLGPMLLNLVVPFTGAWPLIALTQGLIGLCIPFRIVSINGVFLARLAQIGLARAGWYRAAMSIGTGMVGPWLASGLIGTHGAVATFCVASASFAGMALFSRVLLGEAAPPSPGASRRTGGLRALFALAWSRDIREQLVVEAVNSATRALVGTYTVVLAIQSLGLTQTRAVALLTWQGAVAVIALFGLGHVAQRMTERRCHALGLAGGVAGLLALGLGRDAWIVGAGLAALCAGSSLLHLVNMQHLGRHPADKSQVSSLYNLASMTGAFCGPLVGSAFAPFVGLRAVFLCWLPVVVLVALALRLAHGRRGATQARPAKLS